MSWRNAEATVPPGGTDDEKWGQITEIGTHLSSLPTPSSMVTINSSQTKHNGGGLGISVSNFVWIYVCPIILLVGVVGNCLTIAVMRRKRLRGGTVAIYLVLIAIADTCFLVVGIIPEWLEAMDIVVFKQIHPATCKLEKFIGYSSGDTAIWLLVMFTLDRFVAVCFPLKKSDLCTTKRAKILGAFALLLAITKNFHVFFTRGAEYETNEEGESVLKSNCGRPSPGADHFESFIRPWIAFTMVSAIPLILICTFNIAIVRTLLCMPKPSTPATSPARSTANGGPSGGKTERKYSQTTLMCISVSILFLVTITPSIVLVIGRPYWDREDEGEGPNYMYLTAKGINNALVFMNHSLNFFLYCLTGRRFREQLIAMFAGLCSCPCRNSEFHSSAAQKASLYLKNIHKFSQEFMSTTQKTEETTAGTSYSNTLSLGHNNHSNTSKFPNKSSRANLNGAKNFKREKSKASVKSLDSDSSSTEDIPVDPEAHNSSHCGVNFIKMRNISDPSSVVADKNVSRPSNAKSPATTIVEAVGSNKSQTRCSVYIDDSDKFDNQINALSNANSFQNTSPSQNNEYIQSAELSGGVEVCLSTPDSEMGSNHGVGPMEEGNSNLKEEPKLLGQNSNSAISVSLMKRNSSGAEDLANKQTHSQVTADEKKGKKSDPKKDVSTKKLAATVELDI